MQINIELFKINEILKDQLVQENQSDLLNFVVKNIASLEKAQKEDLSVVFDHDNSNFDPVSIEKIQQSKAGILLASSCLVETKKHLLVKDPIKSLQIILDYIDKNKRLNNTDYNIHSSATINPTAKIENDVLIEANAVIEANTIIGNNSKIGANSFVGKNVTLGSNVIIHPGVKILDRCIIGNNTIIHSGAVIGSDGFGYKVTNQGLRKIPHLGTVKIGNDVEIGANVCIDRATFDETTIEDGVKIDNLVHIAHNVKIGAHTVIIAQTGIAGSTQIGYGCQIGGQVAIKDHISIGNKVKIVSTSSVMKNVENEQIIAGSPAISFNEWKRIIIAQQKLPELLKNKSN